MVDEPGIVIVTSRIERAELARLVDLYFQDMVKYVVDVRRKVAAVGGELHADGKRLLLDDQDADTREQVQEVTFELIGAGEQL